MEEHYFSEYEIRWTYSFGPTIFEKEWIPDLILIPQNTQQVSEILKLANENTITITPRGRGCSIPLTEFCNVISFQNMKSIKVFL